MPKFTVRRAFNVVHYQDVTVDAPQTESAVSIALNCPTLWVAQGPFEEASGEEEPFALSVSRGNKSYPVPPWADQVDAARPCEVRPLRDCADALILAYARAVVAGKPMRKADIHRAVDYALEAMPGRLLQAKRELRRGKRS